jgi:hypothetical protein
MPTIPYKLADGTRVKGVTTIIGSNLGWNKEQLKVWAWREGQSGRDLRKTAQAACDAGTIAHYLIECYLKKTEPDLKQYDKVPDLISLAQQAFANFLEWKAMTRMEPLHMEPHLVSEDYKYGLTPDCIATVSGKVSLFDWKTSKSGVYSDMLMQLAAYEHGWNENNPDQPIEGGAYLLRIIKTDASFHFHHWGNLQLPWEAFKSLLIIDSMKKDIEGML